MENNVCFAFSRSCYFDLQANQLVDIKSDTVISITGQQRTVLRKLIAAYPKAVGFKTLLAEVNCSDEHRLRKVIKLLRDKHSSLKECLRNNRGEYQLVVPKQPGAERSRKDPFGVTASCVLQDMNILVKPHFIQEARQDLFDKLDKAFEKSRVVFLVGCGGIGKSEACKHWAIKKKETGKYDSVIFAQLNSHEEDSNILSLITDDSVFVLTEEFPHQYQHESNEAYFNRKLSKIKQITNERTLIIMDNYDIADPMMEDLLQGAYHLLITTRTMPEDYVFPTILLEEIQDLDCLKKIFFEYLEGERSNIQWHDPYIEKLFELVANHTLAIELIARALRFSEDTPQKLYQKMCDPESHKLIGNVDGIISCRTPFKIIKMLFSLSRLKKDEEYHYISQILLFMAAMPTKGIPLSIMNEWSSGKIRQARHTLVQRSWLREGSVNGVKYLSMHPLIKEVIWDELNPDPNNFPDIIEKFVMNKGKYVDALYHQPRFVKNQYEQIALSLISAFPVRDIRFLEFYCKIQRILHLCANSKAALNLAEQIQALLEKEGKTDTWQYGFIHSRIGTLYASLLRQRDNALVHYEKAIAIMERTAQSDEEFFWLALLYREVGSMNCQDRYLLTSHDPAFITSIEQYFRRGEELASKLLKQGFDAKNLEIYHGTLCVWRSKMAAHSGDYSLANQLIKEAEDEFKLFGYTNTVDAAAVIYVKALICAKKGQYTEEISYLKRFTKIFEDSFGVYHYGYIEGALKLAVAYKNNGQFPEAIAVLKRLQEILKKMMQNNAASINEIFSKETDSLLNTML